MSLRPPTRLPAGFRRAVIVADGASSGDVPAEADAVVFGAVPRSGLVAELRARRPDLAVYAALDGVDDPRLDGIVLQRPDGVLLRDAHSGRDVAALGSRLAVGEAIAGLPDGATAILAAIGHPHGVLEGRGFAGASPRLAGLGVDGPALAGALGEGSALAQARGLVRLAAAAAGVTAFALLTADEASLSEGLAAVREDGFGSVVIGDPALLLRRPRDAAG
ncbi:aldolase [Methylorubrum thiocyanatum]|uniref:aldolase n=1 Tax=Methylorubrum thiocyanatum TaxID=47958 RepID=UPI0036598031